MDLFNNQIIIVDLLNVLVKVNVNFNRILSIKLNLNIANIVFMYLMKN